MTPCVEEKRAARQRLKVSRAALSAERRAEAKEALTATLVPKLAIYRSILSFHSLKEEIDTSSINAILAAQGRLLLPKVEKDSLHVYRVWDLSAQLVQGYQLLWEPDPSQCEMVAIDEIECILLPGLGFDTMHHRIGYGKGHYDRFLARFHTALPITIGIGFKEQLFDSSLPKELHDRPLDQVVLF